MLEIDEVDEIILVGGSTRVKCKAHQGFFQWQGTKQGGSSNPAWRGSRHLVYIGTLHTKNLIRFRARVTQQEAPCKNIEIVRV